MELREASASYSAMRLRAPHDCYKKTEIGLIPEDWLVDCLGKFWSVTDCKHVTADFVASGYPIASIGEVQSRFVDLSEAKQTTTFFYNLLVEGGRKLRVGDLILSRNATVGEVAQVAEWHPLFAMGQDVCLLRKKSSGFSTDYLQAVFRSIIIQNQLSDLMVGSTFKRVNIQQIRTLIVPMPLRAEQQAIAEALSDADALIESLLQLLAKKHHLKQGAMQELLAGNKRLPGFDAKWQPTRFGNLGATYGGLTGKTKADFDNGAASYITFMNVMSNVVIDCATFGRVKVLPTETQNRVCKGDLLFNGSSETPEEVGLCSLVGQPVSDVYLNSFCFGFRLREAADVDALYLAYFFRSEQGRELLKSLAQGATRYNLSKTALLNVALRLPAAEEQTAIAALLSDMDAEIATLEIKLAKARQIKQGMMQQLLTGRIRLV